MPNNYVIFGPSDHEGLTQFWSRSRGEWVERDEATLYNGTYIFSFPPGQLPVGRGVCIHDIKTHRTYTPRRPGKAPKNS